MDLTSLARSAAIDGDYATAEAVLVGEKNPSGAKVPFPETSRSGSWLREAVATLPTKVVLANLWVPRGEAGIAEPTFRLNVELLVLLRHARPGAVVALGREVAVELERQGVLHALAPHPTWHRRFRRAEGPAGYAHHLALALQVPAVV